MIRTRDLCACLDLRVCKGQHATVVSPERENAFAKWLPSYRDPGTPATGQPRLATHNRLRQEEATSYRNGPAWPPADGAPRHARTDYRRRPAPPALHDDVLHLRRAPAPSTPRPDRQDDAERFRNGPWASSPNYHDRHTRRIPPAR